MVAADAAPAPDQAASAKEPIVLEPEAPKPEKPKKASKRSALAAMPEDVDPEAWDAWMVIRKAKRMPLTEYALRLTRKEAERCGLTLAQAVQYCCLRAWAGFTERAYKESTSRGRMTAPAWREPEPKRETLPDDQYKPIPEKDRWKSPAYRGPMPVDRWTSNDADIEEEIIKVIGASHA